jgi:hypothetical protein
VNPILTIPFFGLAWTPLSRQDVVWSEQDRTSGVLVGEFDGTVRPNMEAYGGAWLGNHLGFSASVGIARLTNTTWVDSENWEQRHWGVIRPSFDLRVSPWKPGDHPRPWLHLGMHGDIPSSRSVSNAFTEEEQAAADDLAYDERARLGGVGGRVGVGAEQTLGRGIAVGLTWSADVHQSVLRGDDARAVTTWLGTSAQLLLSFQWPGRKTESAPE